MNTVSVAAFNARAHTHIRLFQYIILYNTYTELFEMIVGGLTTCHTQYT